MTLTPPANAQGACVWRRQKCYTPPPPGTWTLGAGARALASGVSEARSNVSKFAFRGYGARSVRTIRFARSRSLAPAVLGFANS